MEFKNKHFLSQDDAANIAIADLQKKVAPLHLDRYVETQRYFGDTLLMIFVHENGTIYGVENNGTIYRVCDGPNCHFGDGSDPLKGQLFYDVNGSWQDSSVKNCSPFTYAIDAQSGVILWSRVGDSKADRCDVRPPDWQR
jgi:hypothetical protein